MSRSYKHTPISKQKNDKGMKIQAARALRHHDDELANGNAYKRLFCSWNICDWSFFTPFKEFYKYAMEMLKLRYPSKSDRELDKMARNEYRKTFISK